MPSIRNRFWVFLLLMIATFSPLLPAWCQKIRTLQGHSSSVYSVAFSPDGGLLASGSSDKTIKLWEISSGRLVRTLQGHSEPVWSVAFSPDGGLLASGSSDKTIELGEVSSGRLVRTLKGHGDWVRSVAFSPDGGLLASGSDDKTIKLWEVSSGRLVRTLKGHGDWVGSVAFSADGGLLASGSEDKTIKLWEVSSGRLVRTLKGHGKWVNSVAFSADGGLLASGSEDKTIKLWEVSSGRLVRTLKGHSNDVYSVSFSPDGGLLASGSRDNTIKLWEVSSGRLVGTLKGHGGSVYSVAFSPDGRLLASGGGDGTIKLWNLFDYYIPKRGLPPNLFADLNFIDQNRNGILEATEEAQLELTLYNKGKGKAQKLHITIQDNQPDPELKIGEEKITYLNPGDSLTITIPMHAGINLKTAQHKLTINVREYFGYDMDPAFLILNTQAYNPPKLVFAGMEIVDSGEDVAPIVADGMLQAGELVKARIVVQNVGQYLAEDVVYAVVSKDPNIYLENGSGSLGSMEIGETKEFWVTISPNKRVTTRDTLPIYLTVKEKFGKGNLIDFRLPIRLNQSPPQPQVVTVKPDIQKLKQQIARFEFQSPKFRTRLREVMDIQNVPQAATVRKNSLAVVLGIENYKYLPPAPYASNDAELIKLYLQRRLGVERVVTYKNEEISGFAFEDIFDPFNGELQKEIVKGKTELFVYYSGHALPGENGENVYLFPYDGKIERLERQGFALTQLYEYLRQLGARHVTVIIDACFSGAARASGTRPLENLIAARGVRIKLKQPWITDPNFTVMVSSRAEEISLSFDKTQTGLFTYYLAAGLKGKADLNGDRKITLGELKNYVTRNVIETSRKIRSQQTPQFYGNDQEVLVQW